MIFLRSTSDFYCDQMTFLCSADSLHIQQMTFTFNKKLIYPFAFNEMKFIKLKSFTFNKPNLDVTKYTSIGI